MIALLSYLVFLTAGHTTLQQLGRLAAADPTLGLYGSGQAVVLGIQTVDMGVTGGVLLGFLTGWGLQPDLREKVPPCAAAHLRGRPLVVLVHDGGVGRAGAGLLLCVAAHPAGGGRPHRVDRRGRGCGTVPLRLFGAGFDPHRPAPSDLHPVPVQFGGRHFDGGGARLYRSLRRPDGRVQHGAALFGQHPLDVHRLYQDLRLFWDRGGLHLVRPARKAPPHRGHALSRCC